MGKCCIQWMVKVRSIFANFSRTHLHGDNTFDRYLNHGFNGQCPQEYICIFVYKQSKVSQSNGMQIVFCSVLFCISKGPVFCHMGVKSVLFKTVQPRLSKIEQISVSFIEIWMDLKQIIIFWGTWTSDPQCIRQPHPSTKRVTFWINFHQMRLTNRQKSTEKFHQNNSLEAFTLSYKLRQSFEWFTVSQNKHN